MNLSILTAILPRRRAWTIFSWPFFFLLLTVLPPKTSHAAITLEGQYNGGARVKIPAPHLDIFPAFGVVKNYKLQSIATATKQGFNISLTSINPLNLWGQPQMDTGIFEEAFGLKIFAVDAGGVDLWSLEVNLALNSFLFADTVVANDVSLTHIVAPHPGEAPNNKVMLRDMAITGAGAPIFGQLPGFTGDRTGNTKLHGQDIDVVSGYLLGRKTVNVVPGGPPFTTNFSDWSLQIEAQHVPEPSSIICLATLSLPLIRSVRRRGRVGVPSMPLGDLGPSA